MKPRRRARRGDFTKKWPNEAPTRTLCGIRPRTAFTINSTRRTPRGSQNEKGGGRGKKESEILGGAAEGGPAEGTRVGQPKGGALKSGAPKGRRPGFGVLVFKLLVCRLRKIGQNNEKLNLA